MSTPPDTPAPGRDDARASGQPGSGPEGGASEIVSPATDAGGGPARSRWQRIRTHPVLGRLPILIVIALGYWLYADPSAPSRRELVFQIAGPAREEVRALDIQIVDGRGVLLERAQRFYEAAPPAEVRLEPRLPQDRFQVSIHARDGEGAPLSIQRRDLEISEKETYLLRLTVRRPVPDAASP